MKSTLLALALTATPVLASENFDAFERCYQKFGQVEESQEGGKKITTYKTESEVAVECNDKILAQARQEKSLANVLKLADIVGRNSNWQSTMPIYAVAVKLDKKKDVCDSKDPRDALKLALSSPADHPHAKGAMKYIGACWPTIKEQVVDLLTSTSNAYYKEHLCKFLKSKAAMTPDLKSHCAL